MLRLEVQAYQEKDAANWERERKWKRLYTTFLQCLFVYIKYTGGHALKAQSNVHSVRASKEQKEGWLTNKISWAYVAFHKIVKGLE